METLLNLRRAQWLAGVAATVAGIAMVLFLTGVLDFEFFKNSIPGEVLGNCGIAFATPMIAVAVFGVVYAWLILRRIPSSQSIRTSAARLLGQIAEVGQQEPEADTVPSAGGPATPESGPPAGQEPARSASSTSSEATEDGPASQASAGSAREPGEVASDPNRTWTGLLALIELVHPWLHHRLHCVLPTLVAQGPEAAREENRVASECDESDVAIAMSPGRICEWVLPLLGFVGTVWGLHKAIHPLSQGVELMMEAIGPNGSEAMRQEAMGYFTLGFAGLRIAFDTTLVGLLGVVGVGWLLYRVRGRAMKVLGELQWVTEEILRSFPQRSNRELFQQIALVLRQGLLTERGGQPQSRLGALQETVQQGLSVSSGRGGSGVPWFQHVVDSIRSNVVGALDVLVRLGAWQLHENRKQTRIQAEHIAPDLRALRRKALPDEAIMDDLLARLRFDHVAEVEQNLEIQALAVTNRAASVAIGGYNRNAARRFLHEQRIDWLGRTLKVDFHPIYSEQVQDLLPEDDAHPTRAHEPSGDVLGLTYSPDGEHLYLLCVDGLVLRFCRDEMREYGPLAGVFDRDPFIWFPGVERAPLVNMWRRQPGGHRFELASFVDEATAPPLAADIQEFLDSFERSRRQDSVELKIRAHGGMVCFAGRNGPKQRLVACGRNGGPLWEVAGRLLADDPVTSFDVCQRRGSIVFAKQHEGIFEWTPGEHRQPECLVEIKGPRAISHLFLNADGNILVAIMGDQIAAFSLNDPQRPRMFETYGGNVTRAVHSLDRNSVALSTENNLIWLLSFQDPL